MGILSPVALLRLLSDVVAVVILAPLIPTVLVVAVIFTLYGDVVKKRNWWTGLELSAVPRAAVAPEQTADAIDGRPWGLERKGYIKRWLILLVGALLLGAVEGVAATSFQSELIFRVLWICYGIPAAVLMVKWSTERVENAGRHGAWGLLILVPVVSFFALVAFSLLPSHLRERSGLPK